MLNVPKKVNIFLQFCNFWLKMLIGDTFKIVLLHLRENTDERRNDCFLTILDAIHITSHILPSLFTLITSGVRVKMFHISKITLG